MKVCPYCLGPVDGRGIYCDPKHARRAAAQLAARSSGRRRAIDRLLAAVQRKARYRRQWRQIAMGENVQGNLEAIFGADTLPAP